MRVSMIQGLGLGSRRFFDVVLWPLFSATMRVLGLRCQGFGSMVGCRPRDGKTDHLAPVCAVEGHGRVKVEGHGVAQVRELVEYVERDGRRLGSPVVQEECVTELKVV